MTILTLANGNSILVDKRLTSSAQNRCRYQAAGTTNVISVQSNGTLKVVTPDNDGPSEQFYESSDGYTSVDLSIPGDVGFTGKLTGDSL